MVRTVGLPQIRAIYPGALYNSLIVVYLLGKKGNGPTSLPFEVYYQLIDNNQSMVLPGLRQYPPPIENDDHPPISHRMSLPPSPANRNPDYADIEVLAPPRGAHSSDNVAAAAAPTCAGASADDPPSPVEYHNIDDLPSSSESSDAVAPLRSFPAARRVASGPRPASLASSINTLHHQGWYWGPLNREDTEAKLRSMGTGAFLVRDSNDEHHLYTLSFRQDSMMLHTRIEFVNGLFTFFLSEEKARETGKASVVQLIETAMLNGVKGEFGDTRRLRQRGQVPIKIILTTPVSRFNDVRSLQFLCKFVLRANMNRDNVVNLPLPEHVKSWVQEKKYF